MCFTIATCRKLLFISFLLASTSNDNWLIKVKKGTINPVLSPQGAFFISSIFEGGGGTYLS